MLPSSIFVWLQTTVRRDAAATKQSIEASDIGTRYTTVTDTAIRSFPTDYPKLQTFWSQSWREMIVEAKNKGCSHILRLEDDVVINKHILHNICQWRALQSPVFGLGTLFVPNYWLKKRYLFVPDKHCPDLPGKPRILYRNTIDVEGAQGQVLPVDRAHEILDGVARARNLRGLDKPIDQVSFDWALSRSAYHLGLRTFVHLEPHSLVDLHRGSLHSQIDLQQHFTAVPASPLKHYWGNDTFSPNWRA